MDLILAPLGTTLATAVRIAAGLILLTGAISKFRHRDEFAGIVADYRLLPPGLATVAALMLPPAELALGALLVAGVVAPFAAPAAAALFVLFATAMGINLHRGRTSIDCGCSLGGGGQPLHRALVIRNLVIAAALLATAALPAPASTMMLANAAAAGILLFVFYHLFNQVVALAGRFATRL